jgi:hypothetical protein
MTTWNLKLGRSFQLPHPLQFIYTNHHNLFIYGAAVEPSPLLLWPFTGLLYQPWMTNGDDDWGTINAINGWQGKQKYSEITCLGAALSTTDPTRLDSRSIPDRRGGNPATNGLSYGMTNHQHNIRGYKAARERKTESSSRKDMTFPTRFRSINLHEWT